MTGVLRILRLSLVQRPASSFDGARNCGNRVVKRFQSVSSSSVSTGGSRLKTIVLVSAVGGTAAAAYSFLKREQVKTAILNSDGEGLPVIWKELPHIRVSKEVDHPNKSLDITIFQYPTCPFCCKVRAFLDYSGLAYKVVEVNPIRKTELKWSDYKKVPILLLKVDGGYMQLNDSTVIISVLKSYLLDPSYNMKEVVKFYPNIAFMSDEGEVKKEVLNRYHVMYQAVVPDGSTKEGVVEERNKRKWADDVLVHMLSPNVYRTRSEAIESFKWFSKAGDWDSNFSSLEVGSIVQIGSSVMWLLGKKLKKKYGLKEDVRQSLYDSCNDWLKTVRSKGTEFHGGRCPDLADLAVFGVLSSIEGCSAFADVRANTKISDWYDAMKRSVARHDGHFDR